MKFLYLSLILLLVCCNKTTTEKPEQDPHKKTSDSTSSTLSKEQDLQVFTFEDDLCTYDATYDANKHSIEEITGAYRLFYRHYEDFMVEGVMVFDMAALNKVRTQKAAVLKKMDEEYDRKAKNLMALEIPKSAYWIKVKEKQLESLEKSYQKNRLEVEAYSDPKILLGHPFSKGDCESFANALNADKETLLKFWKSFREERSRMNSDPEGMMKKFGQESSASNYFDYATIDLITFGWGNCVPEYSEFPVHDENIQKEFQSLFTKMDQQCDEP